MKKCVFWCLQSQETLPEDLVIADNLLSNYVIPDEEAARLSYWPDRAWYDFNCEKFRKQRITILDGRYQVEMLIRTSNQAIRHLSVNWENAMDQIHQCCAFLCSYHDVFGPVSADNAHCKSVQVANICIING